MEQFKDDILNVLIEGFQLISYEWKYLYVNEAVIKHSKYNSKEELMGYTMMEKYPGIEKTPLFRELEKCMVDREPISFINEFEYPDGTKGWFDLRIHPVPEGIYILSIDISDQKKAELLNQEYTSKMEEIIHLTSDKIHKPVSDFIDIISLIENEEISEVEFIKLAKHLKKGLYDIEKLTKELKVFIEKQKMLRSKKEE